MAGVIWQCAESQSSPYYINLNHTSRANPGGVNTIWGLAENTADAGISAHLQVARHE